jgi:TPR repeat protein
MKRPFTLILAAFSALAVVLWIVETQDDSVEADIRHFRAIEPSAEKGDPDAQYALAGLYREGSGVGVDPRVAAQWTLKAAKKGHVAARHSMGRIFETGQGVKRNFQKAAEWYGLAARIGDHAEAQYDLGTLYYLGRGVSHDNAAAMKWYRKAARQGHAMAQYFMGAMIEQGWGGAADPVEAYAWYTLAMGKAEQIKVRNPKYKPEALRDKLARKMTRFQIGQAEEMTGVLMAGR